MSQYLKIYNEIREKITEENYHELIKNIDSSSTELKIVNYINDNFLNVSIEDVKKEIKENRLIASIFMKNATKQNLGEKAFEKLTGLTPLPANGPNSVRFNKDGDVEHLSKKHGGVTKSADYIFDDIYITQKFTTGAGGAQDNQRADVRQFLELGSLKNKVCAALDGDYWDGDNFDDLKEDFKDNENVMILRSDELNEYIKEVNLNKIKNEIKNTQHFTTNSEYICSGLSKYVPEDAVLIEPFVGNKDLISLFPEKDWEMYDLEPVDKSVEKRDTLINPPDYKGKWVITNPPYMARNKANDKTLFNLYGLNDLYKISLKTLLDAEGGIIIIPTNFFTDERSGYIRKTFFNKFDIKEINVFTTPVFESTTYSICSFAFIKKREESNIQEIKINIYPENISKSFLFEEKYDYRLAGKEFHEINSIKSKFSRLRDVDLGNEDDLNICNIKVITLDRRNERISLNYDTNRHYGISTDRIVATLVSSEKIDEKTQELIVNSFNEYIEELRENYHNLIFTNYRDYNRKRVSFNFVYKLTTKIYEDLKRGNN